MMAAVSVWRRVGGLKSVSVSVAPGEVVAILGPNGAGKSTLLGLLAGEAAPDAGAIALDGRPMRAWDRAALARRRAVLAQSTTVAFAMRARDIVALGRSPHFGTAAAGCDDAAVWEALAEADVAHLADRSYETLSGGEKQRVQLARVLAQIWHPARDAAPRYLLLDEPTASLDLAHQHALFATLRRLAERGVGIAVVLHDLNHAARCADRVLVLKRGEVAAAGEIARALAPEVVAEVFGVEIEILASRAGLPVFATAPPEGWAGFRPAGHARPPRG
jgi:iron complex transport system ATP-binding protein